MLWNCSSLSLILQTGRMDIIINSVQLGQQLGPVIAWWLLLHAPPQLLTAPQNYSMHPTIRGKDLITLHHCTIHHHYQCFHHHRHHTAAVKEEEREMLHRKKKRKKCRKEAHFKKFFLEHLPWFREVFFRTHFIWVFWKIYFWRHFYEFWNGFLFISKNLFRNTFYILQRFCSENFVLELLFQEILKTHFEKFLEYIIQKLLFPEIIFPEDIKWSFWKFEELYEKNWGSVRQVKA